LTRGAPDSGTLIPLLALVPVFVPEEWTFVPEEWTSFTSRDATPVPEEWTRAMINIVPEEWTYFDPFLLGADAALLID